MDSKQVRELLSSKDQTDETVKHFIEEKIKQLAASEDEHEQKNDFLKLYSHALETFYPSGVENIYKYSESEIEKVFLNSLLLSFLVGDPLGFVIKGPHPNIPSVVKMQRERLRTMLKLDAELKENLGDDENFVTYLKFLLDEKHIDEEQYKDLKMEYMAMCGLRFNHAFFLVMQAGLPDIKVNNRSVRVDMFIYVPGDDKFNLVVECDGFMYHSGKQSFISDRKRDRVLRANGFDVLRFSGSEIYNDPAGAGIELYEYLQSKKMQTESDV